ncbi:MAG: hypothetical protein A3H17_03410 [Candidatus Levybacteria bacterium RIFCSPLOWO2_12_FULL_37_14]|nr:MAG: hypothetical protein US43_C0002G0021 [Candidatus Levybacteria bacterium GW2011_GWA1_37_16]KKQ38407.1 MAG: hypothetical protein US55_C0007G0016 [Candidatus Levybacteria bacterium GW2011_GWC2_37_7]KKQ40952.1 MAG: hypothetical protein US59_C0042G0002 [Candidatus Levybacteria bacterium GW2011_GWB1_37_8]OGH49893.1 MAG: hypothetical protein A3H17_03410 [Candidatus Levybacteria bacterium RIFCSPLOWO2_12_FULL_37_14]
MSEANLAELETQHLILKSDVIETNIIGKEGCWNDSLSQAVMSLHDGTNRRDEWSRPIADSHIPPKLIFATATSSVPYAFAIKECWSQAYPNEAPPNFFIIDVSNRRFGGDNDPALKLSALEARQIEREEINRLKSIGKKYNALDNTAVFDEYTASGQTLRRVNESLELAGFQDINFLHGHWHNSGEDLGPTFPEEIKPIIRKKGKMWKELPFMSLNLQINEGSKKLVEDMKTIGKRMATEILAHNRSVKKIEK